MHIEIFEGGAGWHWHFRSKGRVTADSEAFPSKANATRAAKAVVTGVFKRIVRKPDLVWVTEKQGAVTVIAWSD